MYVCRSVKGLTKKLVHSSNMFALVQERGATGPNLGMRWTLRRILSTGMMLANRLLSPPFPPGVKERLILYIR